MKNSLYDKTGIIVFILLIATQLWAQNGAWEYLEPLPEPRAFATAAVLDGQIYIIGGLGNESIEGLTSVVRFDPVTEQWDTSVADLPIPLIMATASVLDDKLYVIGGHSVDPPTTNSSLFKPLPNLFQYDPLINSWVAKADMNNPRALPQSIVLDDKIIVMGGARFGAAYQSVEMYNPEEDAWTFLDSMHIARAAFAAELVDGRIYVLGGATASGGPSIDVEVYDPQTKTWTIIEDLPEPLWAEGSALVNNQVLLFGGLSEKTSYLPPFGIPYITKVLSTKMWMWDSEHNWDSMSVHLPDTLGGFAYAQIKDQAGNDCIYAFGGSPFEYWQPPDKTRAFSNVVRRYCFNNSTTGIADVSANIEAVLKIYPNPVHTNATFQYTLLETSNVVINIFDASGHQVARLVEDVQHPGDYTIDWHAGGFPSGFYYCVLLTDHQIENHKFLVTK